MMTYKHSVLLCSYEILIHYSNIERCWVFLEKIGWRNYCKCAFYINYRGFLVNMPSLIPSNRLTSGASSATDQAQVFVLLQRVVRMEHKRQECRVAEGRWAGGVSACRSMAIQQQQSHHLPAHLPLIAAQPNILSLSLSLPRMEQPNHTSSNPTAGRQACR